MSMLEKAAIPSLPNAPAQYDPEFMNQYTRTLRLFFTQLNAVQVLNLSGLLLNLNTLPTEADIATLRAGTVYRDTADPTNTLKIKV